MIFLLVNLKHKQNALPPYSMKNSHHAVQYQLYATLCTFCYNTLCNTFLFNNTNKKNCKKKIIVKKITYIYKIMPHACSIQDKLGIYLPTYMFIIIHTYTGVQNNVDIPHTCKEKNLNSIHSRVSRLITQSMRKLINLHIHNIERFCVTAICLLTLHVQVLFFLIRTFI